MLVLNKYVLELENRITGLIKEGWSPDAICKDLEKLKQYTIENKQDYLQYVTLKEKYESEEYNLYLELKKKFNKEVK
jgi:IS30 family transposase